MGNRVVIAQFEDTKAFEQFECRRQSQTYASLSVGHGASNDISMYYIQLD